MIAGSKYDGLLVDLWSCGIILYAMLCGYLPFEDPNTTELYNKILKGKFDLPDFLSEDAKDIIKKILNTDPKKRYKISDIRKHPWYSLVKPRENDEGIMIGYKPVPIDNLILNELKKYKIEPDYAKKCIEANRHNDITTTYYLLVTKYQREGKKNIINPNSSLSIQGKLSCSLKKAIASYETNIDLNEVERTCMNKVNSNTLDDSKCNNTLQILEGNNSYEDYIGRSRERNSKLTTKVGRMSTKFEQLFSSMHNRREKPYNSKGQNCNDNHSFYEDPLEIINDCKNSCSKSISHKHDFLLVITFN